MLKIRILTNQGNGGVVSTSSLTYRSGIRVSLNVESSLLASILSQYRTFLPNLN